MIPRIMIWGSGVSGPEMLRWFLETQTPTLGLASLGKDEGTVWLKGIGQH